MMPWCIFASGRWAKGNSYIKFPILTVPEFKYRWTCHYIVKEQYRFKPSKLGFLWLGFNEYCRQICYVGIPSSKSYRGWLKKIRWTQLRPITLVMNPWRCPVHSCLLVIFGTDNLGWTYLSFWNLYLWCLREIFISHLFLKKVQQNCSAVSQVISCH